MTWPTLEEVKTASREKLGTWYRFLPSARDEAQLAVQNLIYHRFHELGAFTPGLSKAVGWESPKYKVNYDNSST